MKRPIAGDRFLVNGGNCVEFIGVQGENHACFEIFETGYMIYIDDDGLLEAMEREKFVQISFPEWRRRVVALNMFEKENTGHLNYLGCYAELENLSDKEIEDFYKDYQPKDCVEVDDRKPSIPIVVPAQDSDNSSES